VLDEEGNLERKADIFSKRTIRKAEPVTSVDTASEALALSIGEKASVDLPYMAELTGKTEEEIVEELQGVIFKNPLTDQYETSDAYLSGNVREKLRIASQFSENNEEFAVNVTFLEKVQPKDLDASGINVRLGSTWIPEEDVKAFIFETLQPGWRAQRYVQVHYFDITGEVDIRSTYRTLALELKISGLRLIGLAIISKSKLLDVHDNLSHIFLNARDR
jgi:N12 class adenine-specific DNA methylase